MGIDMLKMSETLQKEDLEYLDMMTGATEFMTDTLNNVLNMHKIEEGKLELDMAPFSLLEAAEKVTLSEATLFNLVITLLCLILSNLMISSL